MKLFLTLVVALLVMALLIAVVLYWYYRPTFDWTGWRP